MSCFESFWWFLNVILDCSGFSAAPAHIKLAAIIIIIQTLWLFSSRREPPFVVQFWEHWISYFPNLVCRGSFVFWIDSERFLSQKFSDCCKISQTSIFCSKCYNLLQPPDNFLKRDLFVSTSHEKPLLCAKFESNLYISFQIIPFAANQIILQHFAATWYFFKKETCLNLLHMTIYSYVPSLEVINALVPK